MVFIITLVILWILLMAYAIKASLNNQQEKLKQQKAILVSAARAYADEIRAKKKMPIIQTTLFLAEGEYALLEEQSQLSETRAVRRSSGGFGGLRVTKRVTLGGYSGASESSQEWRTIDSGKLTLTNQRLIFDGHKGNKTIKLKNILSVQNVSSSSLQMSFDNKSKDASFGVGNAYIWVLAISLLKQVDNPQNLSDVNLQLEFA